MDGLQKAAWAGRRQGRWTVAGQKAAGQMAAGGRRNGGAHPGPGPAVGGNVGR
ncbi:hypothetical protein [Azospirillum largimobile]